MSSDVPAAGAGDGAAKATVPLMTPPETLPEVERRNVFLQLLQVVSVAANGAPTVLTAALQSTLDEVCARTPWTIGHVFMPCDDGSDYFVSSGIWHTDDATQLTGLRRRHDGIRFATGVGLAGRVLSTGVPEHIEDIRNITGDDADRLRCALVDAENVRAVAAFPIMLPGETGGVIEFFSEFPFEVDPLLLDVLVQVGILLGRVLERSRYEAALRDERERAEVASSVKSDFMARMNHELRTPLNVVLGFTELLQLGDLPDEGVREGVVAIQKAGNHLLSLINDILEVTRLEGGSVPLFMEPLALGMKLADITALLAPLAESRHIDLETESPDGAELHVLADKRALKQVIINLTANAIKYNREGGRVVTTVARDGVDHVSIAVSDTGYGIPDEHLVDIFVPFERLGMGASVEGTGLGLSISKQLTEAMGGTLHVESTVGVGSTFTVALLEADAPPAGAEDTLSPAAALSPTGEHTVLYVEDNVANIQLMESIFASRQSRTQLIVTKLGDLALGLAKVHLPHLILLDIGLPDINGAEVLRRLKGDDVTKDIPVVIVSADVATSQIDRVLAEGAYDYITKPINVVRLLEIVDRTARRRPEDDVQLLGRPPVGKALPGKGSRSTEDSAYRDGLDS